MVKYIHLKKHLQKLRENILKKYVCNAENKLEG